MNRLGHNKKTGPLRKFKSVTFDKYNSNSKKSIKNFILNG